jgi:hypothetical protein
MTLTQSSPLNSFTRMCTHTHTQTQTHHGQVLYGGAQYLWVATKLFVTPASQTELEMCL